MQMRASCAYTLECGSMPASLLDCCERVALSPTSLASPTCGYTSQINNFQVSRPPPNTAVLVAPGNNLSYGRRYAYSPQQSPKMGGRKSLAPLELQSSAGQLLIEMLESQGQLVSTAAGQQLELLAADRQVACTQQHINSGPNENILYRRIAELKAEEIRRTIQEIMYALVVEKLLEAGVTMTATMAPSQKMASFPMQDKELEAVHAAEVQKMVEEHVAMVIGGKNASPHFDPKALTQISKLRMGQIYAATVMYGYFLRRAVERFRLELSFKTLGFGHEQARTTLKVGSDRGQKHRSCVGCGEKRAEAGEAPVAEMTHGLYSSGSEADGAQGRSEFKDYIKSFDAETLQRIGKMRSGESVEVIERHVEALFGKPQMVEMGDHGAKETNMMKMKLGGVKSLVLEALAFGTFLWDAEAYVDSHYPLSLEN